MKKKTIRVAAAVIYQDDRIFATARGYGEFKGLWEFPGGKIELEEPPLIQHSRLRFWSADPASDPADDRIFSV